MTQGSDPSQLVPLSLAIISFTLNFNTRLFYTLACFMSTDHLSKRERKKRKRGTRNSWLCHIYFKTHIYFKPKSRKATHEGNHRDARRCSYRPLAPCPALQRQQGVPPHSLWSSHPHDQAQGAARVEGGSDHVTAAHAWPGKGAGRGGAPAASF